jgi:hypothetical protein
MATLTFLYSLREQLADKFENNFAAQGALDAVHNIVDWEGWEERKESHKHIKIQRKMEF